MTDNPHIQRVGNTMFNLLLVDEWLVGLFRTNNDVWRFLTYLGEQLDAGEPVPNEIHVFTIVTTGTPEVEILETAKIVKTPLKMPPDENGVVRIVECFLYTAIHDGPEVAQLTEIVQSTFPQIMEVLYE